jgi:choline dehydrogenase-like flavoprotein
LSRQRSPDFFMLINNIEQLNNRTGNSSRFVVIGSGAVGLYTANELVKRGHRAVVVESGGTALGGFPAETFQSVGAKHEGIGISRSRTLGGTTNLWGGQLVEFQPVDFHGRDWMPGSKWPVAFEEIAPYFVQTYENLGVRGDAQDDKAVWKAVGADQQSLDEGMEIFLTRWLKVPNFATYYAEAIANSENLMVLIGHTVVGFSGTGERIDAVKVKDAKGVASTIEGTTFIIAAGTIETSRLLLCSALDSSWTCPWRHNANIGKCFQDHLVGRVAFAQVENHKRFFNSFCSIVWSGQKFAPKIRLRNDVLERERLMNIHGWFVFESSVTENLVYLKQFVKAAIYSRKILGLADLFKNLVACAKYLVPLMWRYVINNRIFVPSTSKISLVIQAEQIPCAESQIRIEPTSLDANGMPRVVLDWKISGEEFASVREFTLRVDRSLRAAGMGHLKLLGDLDAGLPRFMATLKDQAHQSGGALMGISEVDGVVDRNLKLFGTQNLFVAGSSTFRTISNANTTFMALTFATRLVDYLTEGKGRT